jgi:thioredoxin 1
VSNGDTKSSSVEVLTASGCGSCATARALAREVIAELGDSRVHSREISVLEEIDYAVRLWVLSTPAMALNGEQVFAAPPSKASLHHAIVERLGGA